MKELLAKVRTRFGYTALGALAALTVGGVGTAAVIDSPATEEVSDVESVTTEPAETTSPAEPTDVVEPEVAVQDPESPDVVTPGDTVGDVTEPEPTVAPEPEPTIGNQGGDSYDPAAPYTDSSGYTYIPSPPDPGFEPLQNEPGYVKPAPAG